jgi:hypothetical protein
MNINPQDARKDSIVSCTSIDTQGSPRIPCSPRTDLPPNSQTPSGIESPLTARNNALLGDLYSFAFSSSFFNNTNDYDDDDLDPLCNVKPLNISANRTGEDAPIDLALGVELSTSRQSPLIQKVCLNRGLNAGCAVAARDKMRQMERSRRFGEVDEEMTGVNRVAHKRGRQFSTTEGDSVHLDKRVITEQDRMERQRAELEVDSDTDTVMS